MRLGALIDGLDLRLPMESAAEIEVRDVTEDSRAVAPGSLFVARPGGSTDGRRFIDEAINRGAGAVLVEKGLDGSEVAETFQSISGAGKDLSGMSSNTGVSPVHRRDACATDSSGRRSVLPAPPIIECRDAGRIGAELAERLHGRPSCRLTLIGVTGSNGKTTTTHLIRQLLNAGGVRCGLIGTVYVDDGVGGHDAGSISPPALTTPAGPELSRLLRRMVDNGCEAAVMEVSSHALTQGRVDALDFDIAVFTNLSGEHQDYHGSMVAYAAAKARLFERLPAAGLAIVNADDPHHEQMVRGCPAPTICCRLVRDKHGGIQASRHQDAEFRAPSASEGFDDPRATQATATEAIVTLDLAEQDSESVDLSDAGAGRMRLKLDGPWAAVNAAPALVGEYNAMNLLQASAAAWAAGLSADRLCEALRAVSPPPGRLERVALHECDPAPTILVDYAHTDAALENVLGAVRPMVPPGGRLIVVFGAGGDRDKAKRPRMGAVAARLADEIIITSDNPRTENPEAIIRDILDGMPTDAQRRALVELDRERAIRTAINRASERDVVMIAGKGHEDYQIVSDGRGGTVRRAFDDRIAAREALREWASSMELAP